MAGLGIHKRSPLGGVPTKVGSIAGVVIHSPGIWKADGVAPIIRKALSVGKRTPWVKSQVIDQDTVGITSWTRRIGHEGNNLFAAIALHCLERGCFLK